MSEMALVSARKIRLQQRAEEGDVGAKAALTLAESPGNFLSTVQIGITLVGILAGTVGGATLAARLTEPLGRIPLLGPYAQGLSVGIAVLGITYLSLVVGELAPKRLALNHAEGISTAIAPFMSTLAWLMAPIVRVLGVSTDLILWLIGSRAVAESAVTEEDVRTLIEQGTQVGVFEPLEEEIVDQVFRLSDRTVNALLTPRIDIVWLDIKDPPEKITEKVIDSGFSFFPVAEEDLDHVLGLVSIKSLLAQSLKGQPLHLESVLQSALFLPDSTPALVVVERLKENYAHMALVIDEHGGLEGLVTINDILAAIVGDIPEAGELVEAQVIQREDGSWLIDGMMQIDEFQELLEIKELPEAVEDHYQTVGGLVMAMLGRIPSSGDYFEWEGYRLEVMDMDLRRVDKVLVARL
ncbi:hemolysin family protein [soil metagenome]